MICEGCGNQHAYRQFIRWAEVKDENQNVVDRVKVEVCDQCGGSEAKPSYFRDAAGNRVSVPTSELGRYSHATGEPILSTRQYSNTLKRLGLSQKEA